MKDYFNARTIVKDGKKVRLEARTEAEVLEDITRFAKAKGRSPTYDDFKNACAFGESVSSQLICRHFNKSWNALLKQLGLEVNHEYSNKSRKKMISDLKRMCKKLNRPITTRDLRLRKNDVASAKAYYREFGSIKEACIAAGVEYAADGMDDNAMLQIICDFIDEHGRPPTAAEFKKTGSYNDNPCSSTYANRFGSWMEAVHLASTIKSPPPEQN